LALMIRRSLGQSFAGRARVTRKEPPDPGRFFPLR
jgi:hypothetical protein